MQIEARRAAEHAKYVRAYKAPIYAMGARRREHAVSDLAALPCRGSYLDVSTGRGEMLAEATRLGFSSVKGTEVVPSLIDGHRVVRAEVHALPFADNSFDVVTMFDVIEHLIPGDDALACRELARVAQQHVLVAANNCRSVNAEGDELHINRRGYEEWDALFREWFAGGAITWRRGGDRASETWRIDL